MEALGSYLKKNREQRGVSLEEMAANTKINLSILSYLEEDRFDKLPAPVFIKGFIRSYLGYLGLNPKEAVLFYELLTGEAQKKPQILSPVTSQNENDKQEQKIYNIRLSQRALIIIVSVSAIVLLTLMYFIVFPSSSTTDDMSEYRKKMLLRMAPQPTSSTPIPTPVEAPASTPVQTQTTPAPVQTTPVQVAPVVPVANPQKITINAKQDVWVKVQIDKGKPFDFLLRAGNNKNLEAKNELKVLMGDASAATIEYQGEVLKDLGQKGDTRSMVFPGLGRWKDALVR